MESAEGKIQEKGYSATFPILVNIADTPSYFISLKDDAGLVKAYSFVSVSNYQIVGVADTLAGAEAEYRRLLKEAGKLEENANTEAQTGEIEATITGVTTAVVDGNTAFYIMLEGSDKIFIADVRLNDLLPFTATGDTVKIAYTVTDGKYVANSIDITLG